MKKAMIVLTIGVFAACNNNSTTETKTDSTAILIRDSVKKDTVIKKVDSITVRTDTSIKK